MTNEESNGEQIRGRYDRRQFLVRSGAVLVLSGSLGNFLAACGGEEDGGVAEEGDEEQLNRALRMHHDAAVGPLFAPYVKYFNENYRPLKLETSYVAQDYFAATNQQLAGGNVDYDVLFADEGYLEGWYKNGWIQSIEEMEGVSELLENMGSGIEENLRASDGTLVALPYFRGAEIFVYNREHLNQIDATPPTSWDEFVSTARELKSKGVTQTPYAPYWIKYAFLIWHQLAAEAVSDGAGPFFGENSEPEFASDPVVHDTLERWRTLYSEGLVPKDIFTTDYGGVTNIFAGGKSSFGLRYQPQLVGWKDPKQSKVADAITNTLIPGSTRKTHSFGAYWFMAASTPAPTQAWTLMNYLGGDGKDNRYYVPKNLIDIDLGLSSGYTSVDEDPAVIESWSKWADVEALRKQLSQAESLGPTVNQDWYPKFAEQVSGILQEVVGGRKSVDDGLKEAADLVEAERD